MELPEGHLNTVVFLCIDRMGDGGTKRVPVATGFYVSDRSLDDYRPAWIVTARHVIEEIRASGSPMFVRVNMRDGYLDQETHPDDWYVSDEDDVAAIFVPSAPEGMVAVTIGLDQLVDADYRYQGAKELGDLLSSKGGIPVRVGHDVFFVGLFSQHAGTERNLPIARFGAVSRLPNERIAVRRTDGRTDQLMAYLVEARSWGGHSGSPAFWCHPLTLMGWMDSGPPGTPWEGQPFMVPKQEYLIGLLGLVSAHFDIPTAAQTSGDVLGRVVTHVNAGMAVITPAEAIRQLLLREDVQQEMEEYRKKAADETPAATFDIAADHAEDEATAFTRGQFMGDLDRVSGPVEKPPQETE